MGATRNTGYLENLIQYDASDNVAIATSVNPSYKVTLGGSLFGTSATFNVGSATTVLGLTGNGDGATIASITNTNTGTAGRSSFQVTSDSSTAHFFASSSTNVSTATGGRASTAGIFTASGDTAGGLAFLARNAAGVITFHTGGNTERVRIAANGAATFSRNDAGNISVTIANAFINQGNLINFQHNTAGTTTQGYIGHGGDNTGNFVILNNGITAVSFARATGAATFSSSVAATSATFSGKLSVSQSSTDFVAEFINTASLTPYGVRIKDAASAANNYPLFQVSNNAGTTEYFRVNSGTGTATFSSSVTATKGFFSSNGASDSTTGLLANASTNDNTTYAAIFGSLNAGYRMVVRADGNVGIGTTSPNAKLHIQGTGAVLNAQSTDDSVPARVVNLSTGISSIGFQANGSTNSFNVRVGCDVNDFIAYTNNTERLRITSGGNVGIGVTPSAHASTWKVLQVGNLVLSGPQPASDKNGIIGANAYYNGSGYIRILAAAATTIELNQGTGDIRTYTTGPDTAGSTITWTNGPYLANGGNSWTNGSSDVRKKKNFETTQGLSEILQIEPIKYNFTWEENTAPKRLGFKAQNLQMLIPEMVVPTGDKAEDGSNYLTITPDYILPVLVKAIQELNQKIEALENR